MRDFLAYCVTCNGKFSASLLTTENRLFDVALNDYTDGDMRYAYTPADYPFHEKGHKWPTIAKLLPQFVGKYKAFCFLDDDVVLGSADVDYLFTEGMAKGLDLWQASLTSGSVEYWKFLYHRVGVGIRPVPLVEVMMPFFSASALALCSPYFEEFESGHALDQMWARVLQNRGMAVLDSVQAGHYRPSTSPRWKMSNGLTAHEDAQRLRKKYGLQYPENK